MKSRVADPRRDLPLLLAGGSVVGLGDGELLARVAAEPGPTAEAAFAALFRRHGPMVARVCRGVLGDAQLAEDAVQAVFLVLARRARSIRDPDRLASWLYGVALRTARAARRRRPLDSLPDHHPGAIPMLDPALDPAEILIRRERADLLLGAIARLPRRYLAPVVLCDLEGLTHAEAAARLNCPAATVSSLIKRAREKLRSSLARHRLDFESALPPAVAATSLPRSVLATASAQLLANRVLGAASAVQAKAVLAAALIAGLAAVAAPGGHQDPAVARPAGVVPSGEPAERQDPPQTPAATNPAVPTPPVAQEPPQPAPVPPAETPGSRLGFPIVRDVRDYEQFVGRVAASRTAELFPSEAGVITSLEVAEGDTVSAGQVLCKLVTSPNLALLGNVRGDLSRATQRLEKIRGAVRDREDAALVQAKVKVENLKESLHRLEIDGPIVPFDGQVVQLAGRVGAAIEVGRVPLATISLTDPAMVDFTVPERIYMKVHRWLRTQPGSGHLPVRVALVDEDDFAHRGRVLFRATQFTGNSNSGPVCLLHAELPNLDRALIPGLTARVRIDYGPSRRAVLVPSSACSPPPGAQREVGIKIVDARNVVSFRSIEVDPSRDYGGFYEVKTGLDPKTRIILRNPEQFKVGDPFTEDVEVSPR